MLNISSLRYYKMKMYLKRVWKSIEGLNGLILILYSFFIFSTDIITNAKLGELYYVNIPYFVVSEILVVVLSIGICPIVIRLLSKVNIRSGTSSGKPAYSKISNIAFYVIPFSFFVLLHISLSRWVLTRFYNSICPDT